ncbi:MAG: ribonuclease Z [Pseudomonadales bacterium]|nr:ribonuclease Z [Pseudomonadales bacterium]NRA14227.1 ribonuclease Z [Oceanospirillaceae bacterium]
MELIFLGTSAGSPTKRRNVSACALRKFGAKRWYLIDCGEGTQQQILHTKLSLVHLEAIFITHVHGDHCYGLPGLLASAMMSGRTKALSIVAPQAIQRYLQAIFETTELQLSFEINFQCVESLDRLVEFKHFKVQKIALSHRVDSVAYHFSETDIQLRLDVEKLAKDKITTGPHWNLLQKGQDVEVAGQLLKSTDYTFVAHAPRKVIISGDNDNPQLLAPFCEGLDLLIHEATYSQQMSDKIGPAPQHCSAKALAKFAQQQQLTKLIMTHFSPRYQYPPSKALLITELEDEARSYYSGQLHLANDFDHFRLTTGNELQLMTTRY